MKITYFAHPEVHVFVAGPDKEFYSFYGQCFESKQNKLQTFHVPLAIISFFLVSLTLFVLIHPLFGNLKLFQVHIQDLPFQGSYTGWGLQHNSSRVGIFTFFMVYVLKLDAPLHLLTAKTVWAKIGKFFKYPLNLFDLFIGILMLVFSVYTLDKVAQYYIALGGCISRN